MLSNRTHNVLKTSLFFCLDFPIHYSHGGEPGSGAGDHADRQQDQGTSCRGQADLQHSRAACQLHHQEQGGQEA